jgi:hypothetical protein
MTMIMPTKREIQKRRMEDDQLTCVIADYLFGVNPFIGDNSSLCFFRPHSTCDLPTCFVTSEAPSEAQDVLSYALAVAGQFGTPLPLYRGKGTFFHLSIADNLPLIDQKYPGTKWTPCGPLSLSTCNFQGATSHSANVRTNVIVHDVAGLESMVLTFQVSCPYTKVGVSVKSRVIDPTLCGEEKYAYAASMPLPWHGVNQGHRGTSSVFFRPL